MARVCTGTRIQGVIGIGHSSCSIVFIHVVYSSLVLRIVMLIQITVVQSFHFSLCPLKGPSQSLNHKLTSATLEQGSYTTLAQLLPPPSRPSG